MANEVKHDALRFVALQDKTHMFFATFADSIRPPHVGEERRNFVKELLLRAEEASLYKPGAP